MFQQHLLLKKVTVRFLTLTDLVAFEFKTAARYQKNYSNNTISGQIEESYIELARKEFNAIVFEEQE